MGIAIADELKKRGADVTLITGRVAQNTNGLKRIKVTSAEEMYEACKTQDYDIAVMAAQLPIIHRRRWLLRRSKRVVMNW
jgi:phosphopantothenoylcysteine synthetase/decarboxylase